MAEPLVIQGTDLDLILLAGCSLDESPRKNWVENAGGLPNYICRIARAVKRTGKTTSQAIAIAVSRVKRWAAGGDGVTPATQAKAAKAVAEWEALRARSKGRQAVKATTPGGEGYLMLCGGDGDSVSSFNIDQVRRAFEAEQAKVRSSRRSRAEIGGLSEPAPDDYRYIKEVWSDFLIVEGRSEGGSSLAKVPYTVNRDRSVTFGEEIPVVQEYVEVDDEDDLTEDERAALAGILGA